MLDLCTCSYYYYVWTLTEKGKKRVRKNLFIKPNYLPLFWCIPKLAILRLFYKMHTLRKTNLLSICKYITQYLTNNNVIIYINLKF